MKSPDFTLILKLVDFYQLFLSNSRKEDKNAVIYLLAIEILQMKVDKRKVYCHAGWNRYQINALNIVWIMVWVIWTFQQVVFPRTTITTYQKKIGHRLNYTDTNQ